VDRHAVRTALHAGVLLSVTGVVPWATGTPFVFPSLGPTAYLLATQRTRYRGRLADVAVAHLLGVVAGLVAYHLLAGGVVVTAELAAGSAALGRVVASGVVALMVTSAGMLGVDAVHPPACATTLIVALGLLPTVFEGGLIVGAVCVLVATHLAATRLTPETA